MPKILRFLENINRYTRTRWNQGKLGDRYSGRHKTRRRYYRHSLLGLRGSFLRLGGDLYPLVNLSYGGISILSSSTLFVELCSSKTMVKGMISVLGISCEAHLGVLYADNGYVGLGFFDESGPIHKFLEKTIFYLDSGLVLKSLSRNTVSHFFQGPSWNSYGNENISAEVHIKFGSKGRLEEVNVSYIHGFRREYVVFSPKATTVATVPEKKLKINAKKMILRNSLLIVIGFRQIGQTDRFDRLIETAIGLLRKQSA